MEIVILSCLTVLASLLLFVIAYMMFQLNAILLSVVIAAVGAVSLISVFADIWR